MAFQFSLEVARTGGDIQQELLTLVARAVKGRERVSWKSKVTNRRPTTSESERAGLPEAGRARGPCINDVSMTQHRGSTGISSQIRTKLRDWAIWQARAGCYSQAALS